MALLLVDSSWLEETEKKCAADIIETPKHVYRLKAGGSDILVGSISAALSCLVYLPPPLLSRTAAGNRA